MRPEPASGCRRFSGGTGGSCSAATRSAGRALVASRRRGRSGESLTQALQRELAEETGIGGGGGCPSRARSRSSIDLTRAEPLVEARRPHHLRRRARRLVRQASSRATRPCAATGCSTSRNSRGWPCIRRSSRFFERWSPANRASTSERCGRPEPFPSRGTGFNVRDLGGLETTSGGRTRHGVVIRADNVRRLSPAGWAIALDHGVRLLVDLRFEGESPDDPSPPRLGRHRRHLAVRKTKIRRSERSSTSGFGAPTTSRPSSRPATSAP